MNLKPKKGHVRLVFLKENFEAKETDSGLLVKKSVEDVANRPYTAEVVAKGDDVNGVDVGDIVYLRNYKVTPIAQEGPMQERSLITAPEGNLLMKREKTEDDELVEQRF